MTTTTEDLTCPLPLDGVDEPLIVEASGSKGCIALFLWVFAIAWCGGTGAGFLSMLRNKEWFGLLCVGLFLAIGLCIAAGAIYTTLQMFNPRPAIILSQRNLFCGSEFEVSWVVRGRSASIHRLAIFVEGLEKVSYRQGTSTRTEESMFLQIPVTITEDRERIAEGFEVVTLPSNTMHTFKGLHNEILWRIKVSGSIRWWPDISDHFPIVVRLPSVTEPRHD